MDAQRRAVQELCERYGIDAPIHWFYTPMALQFARDLPSSLVVYDCMDELSAFHGAPPALEQLERDLFALADLVFTGGRSLYEAKSHLHPRVLLFPSSVDVAHFQTARAGRGAALADARLAEPDDQASIATPRLGFFDPQDRIQAARGPCVRR